MKAGPIKLNADFVFAGGVLHEDAGLRIENGIAQLVPRQTGAIQLKGTVSGGFVDLQVNGGGGVLFNNDPTPEGLLSIAEAHRTFGTTAILPTVITDAPEVLKAAATAVLENAGANGILGLHIEGIGVVPNIVVPVTEDTLFTDEDVVLQTAIDYLQGEIEFEFPEEPEEEDASDEGEDAGDEEAEEEAEESTEEGSLFDGDWCNSDAKVGTLPLPNDTTKR